MFYLPSYFIKINKSLPLSTVVEDYGLETVQEYMYHIRNNAEMSVRNLLKDVAKRAGTNVLSAVDYLDDGSPVSVTFISVYSTPNHASCGKCRTSPSSVPF